MQDARAWVEAKTGRRVIRTRRLRGGLTSDVRTVTLADGETLVLRRYPPPDAEAAANVEREAVALGRLEGSGLPVPRLIAAAPSGDVPMLLMTRLPGRIDLTPRDPEAWLSDIASALVAVHATTPTSGALPVDPPVVEVPGWTSRRDLWERTATILSEHPDPAEARLVHRDFQHFNLLWRRGRITGMVDWVWSGFGHPDEDVAHCRLNLAVLFSADHAERFRERYEAEAGRAVDPWWDLRGLTAYGPDWRRFIPIQVAGRTEVDAAGMDDRVEELMARILLRT